MKKTKLIILIPLLFISVMNWADEIKTKPINGITYSIGGFNYFTTGIGYAFGEYSIFSGHFIASAYGINLEYKTMKEIHARLFGRYYGGSAGMLLGLSCPVAYDFKKLSIGIGPEIGIGFGPVNLVYRYNLYLDYRYNSNEIVLCFLKMKS